VIKSHSLMMYFSDLSVKIFFFKNYDIDATPNFSSQLTSCTKHFRRYWL